MENFSCFSAGIPLWKEDNFTVVIGWIVAFLVNLVIGLIFGVGMAGAGALRGMLSG